jgi:hypothetical protein
MLYVSAIAQETSVLLWQGDRRLTFGFFIHVSTKTWKSYFPAQFVKNLFGEQLK